MKPIVTIPLVFVIFCAASAGAVERPRTETPIAGGIFPATLEAIQENVFTPSCALSFCHGAAMSAGMDLRDGQAYSNIVNVPSVEVPGKDRIEPFDPNNSFLICKLEACPWLVGQQMPLIGGPLEQPVIDVIRAWVLAGAPEFPDVAVEPTSWGRMKAKYR
jgi:hypothetical protein